MGLVPVGSLAVGERSDGTWLERPRGLQVGRSELFGLESEMKLCEQFHNLTS